MTADELGPGSKPEPKLATNKAEAKRDQEDGLELLLALLASLGLRVVWDLGAMDDELKQRVLDELIKETSASLVSLTRDLANRKITPRTWLIRMRDILVAASAAGALLMMGRNSLDDDEESEWISEINLQYGYLVRFFDEIRDGRQILNQGAIARADLYARALWSTSWRVLTGAWVLGARRAGKKLQVIRRLAAADHCFPAGTLIETERGKTPIEHVRLGDLVWTRCGLRRVTRLYAHDHDGPLVRVESGSRSVICTPNHPFLTVRGWVRADCLLNGDQAVLLKARSDGLDAHIALPDSNDRVAASRQVLVSSRVSFLLGDLSVSERLKPGMAVPPVPVGLDDQVADPDIDNKLVFEHDARLVGDAERLKDAVQFDLQSRRPVFLHSGVSSEKPFDEIGARRHFSKAFGCPRQPRGVVFSHVLRRLIVNNPSRRLLRQCYVKAVGLGSYLNASLSKFLGNPCRAVTRVMEHKEVDLGICPDGVSPLLVSAAPAHCPVPPLESSAGWADLSGGRRFGPALQANTMLPLSDVAALRAKLATGTVFHDGPRKLRPGSDLSLQGSQVPEVGRVSVFNLEVEENHEYIANGFVVHNCNDCVAWADEGWVDFNSDDFHPIGTSVCGARCLCSLEFRLVPIDQGEVDGG